MSHRSKLAPDGYRENQYDLLLIYTLTRYLLIYSIDKSIINEKKLESFAVLNK